MNTREIADLLEAKYNYCIEDLLHHYEKGRSRKEIADVLGISEFAARQSLDKLNLKLHKSNKKRQKSFEEFWFNYGSENAKQTEVTAVKEENTYLHHKLGVTERALQRVRDEATHLRAVVRTQTRDDSLQNNVLNLIEQTLPIKYPRPEFDITICPSSDIYKNHVTGVILSDIHAEESVKKEDVGLTNSYNWKTLEKRLDVFFSNWFQSYRGEDRAVVFILGDVISGIIHDILESTTKPTAQAVHDLADLMFYYLSGAAMIFEQVDVLFVSGNHERLSERIKSNSKGFDFGYLFAQLLKAKLANQSNIKVEISTTGHVATKIGDKWAGGMHGDMYRGAKSESRTFRVQAGFKAVLGIDVDHIFEGHTHKFSWHNTTRGASICNGTVMGVNSYGVASGFTPIRPSQTIVQFLPNGEIEAVRQVFLD